MFDQIEIVDFDVDVSVDVSACEVSVSFKFQTINCTYVGHGEAFYVSPLRYEPREFVLVIS